MDAFFDPAGSLPPAPRDGEDTLYVDPLAEREEARQRWPLQAAAWRAMELAELVFGGEVVFRLGGSASTGTFRGLLHLDVPFDGPESHGERQRLFAACAARDEVLAAVPLVFVFAPRPS